MMLGRARNASKHKPKYYQRKDLVVVAFLEFGIKRKEKFYIYSSGAKKKKKKAKFISLCILCMSESSISCIAADLFMSIHQTKFVSPLIKVFLLQ